MNETLAIVWARTGPRETEAVRARRRPEAGPPGRRWPSLAQLRDPVLFAVGLAGIAHQTLVADMVQWELLLTFGAMLGLPLPLRADEARRNGSGGS